MRPVEAGLCAYTDLLDNTLTLADFALMNDFLSVKADNERIAAEIQERERGRR